MKVGGDLLLDQEFTAAGAIRLPGADITGDLKSEVEAQRPAVSILTPQEPARRGCQLSLRIAAGAHRGKQVFDALAAHGVVCDWRSPDIIRVAPVPLYNRFEDAWRFAAALRETLQASP